MMKKVDNAEFEWLRINGSAAVHEIARRVDAGTPFEEAKIEVNREILRKNSKLLTSYPRMRAFLDTIQPVDLPRETLRKVRERVLADIEELRGKKAGALERLWFRLTGTVFWV